MILSIEAQLSTDRDHLPAVVLKKLRHASILHRVVIPGDLVRNKDDLIEYLHGHGISKLRFNLRKSHVVSSISGCISTINRLIFVTPTARRYVAEVGDIVSGCVTDVDDDKGVGRWFIQGRQGGSAFILPLGGVSLTTGEQRRRTDKDRMEMRATYTTDDVIIAEVHKVPGCDDGDTTVHTRSVKYGILRDGYLTIVPGYLVSKRSSHFGTITLPHKQEMYQVSVGVNGWVWISCKRDKTSPAKSIKQKLGISAIQNAVRLLARYHFSITFSSIRAVLAAVQNSVIVLQPFCSNRIDAQILSALLQIQ